MKVVFANSFFESLKKLNSRKNINWRIYDTVRYDVPNFLKNIWLFRKSLYAYRWYDYSGVLRFMGDSFQDMAEKSDKFGTEVDITREKKVLAMRRISKIISNTLESNYIERIENELGEIHFGKELFDDSDLTEEQIAHNKNVFAKANELEEKEWEELFKIFKGQDHSKFDKKINWDKQFDGTGIRGWWD
jgi:hypothetical protein